MTGAAGNDSPQTLDQRRAKHAWEAVQRAKGSGGSHSRDYGGEARKLPMRIMAAGLGHALAFIVAKTKNKPGLEQLHKDLTDWVITERGLKSGLNTSLIDSIVHGDADFLRLAMGETLAYLQWLKRFAEAEGLTEDAEQGD